MWPFKNKNQSIDIDNPYFNQMMFGDGHYEVMKKAEAEREEWRESLIKQLSSRANECSLCGSKDITVDNNETRDGCSAWCRCKNCGNTSSPIINIDDYTVKGLKALFTKWHNENPEFKVIINAPKVVSVIKELKEVADRAYNDEDFSPMEFIDRIRMLEKWSDITTNKQS